MIQYEILIKDTFMLRIWIRIGMIWTTNSIKTNETIDETKRQKMRVHHIFNVEQLHYVLSTTEYDLTRGMYLSQGNGLGYKLHPTGWIE